MCFEQLLHCLDRVGKVRAVVEATVYAQAEESSFAGGAKDQTAVALKAAMDECLSGACELAQRVLSHIVSARSDSNAKMNISEFKLLLETSMGFLASLDKLSSSAGSSTGGLRQCLQTQTKGYINYFHESSKGNLVSVLDSERWEQCDVPEPKQKIIDKLVTGRTFLADKPLNGRHTETEEHRKAGKKEISPALVDGAAFRVVYSAVYLVDLILMYLEIAVSFPSITTDAIAKTGELLSLFDSRVKQLVLGAQAIQTAARLKSISAKHLCLTAQSLGLIATVLPHIRAALIAQLPPKHHILLTGLDRVSASILEHQGEVLAKFVDIVCDFVDSSAGKLPAMDWDVWKEQTVPYFDDIVKNLTALHRVLESLLPVEQVQDVFSRIFAALQRKMVHHFETIRPTTPAGKQRIVDEVSHLVSTVSRFKKIDISTFTVEETFHAKYLKQS